MIVIGLTGSLGMGKTTAAGMLRRLGLPVHDADAAVHRLLAAGGAGVAPVAAAFPASVRGAAIDRGALRAALGGDGQAWARLERILHPLVRSEEAAFIRRARAAGVRGVVLDIPLLFETGAEGRVDCVLCVTAPSFLQWQRARARGLSDADIRMRLSRQMPDAQKRARADFVVQTGLGRGYTFRALRRIVSEIADYK